MTCRLETRGDACLACIEATCCLEVDACRADSDCDEAFATFAACRYAGSTSFSDCLFAFTTTGSASETLPIIAGGCIAGGCEGCDTQ